PPGQLRGFSHAFLYSRGQFHDLGTLPGKLHSRAQGINERGDVAGFSFSDRFAADAHAFLFRDGTMLDLHSAVSLGGSASFASWFNKGGDIVVDALAAGNLEDHAFLSRHSAVTDLGTLGGTFSIADAINNRRQAVGGSSLAGDETFHAVLFDGAARVDLGSLGGSYAEALSINDSGEIVGFSLLPGDETQHAFVYRRGVLSDLHTPSLPASSAALGINNDGVIVGLASPSADDTFDGNLAVIWRNGAATDLNTRIPAGSGWQLYRAAAINDRGEIAGVGNHNGAVRAFLLVPVKPAHQQ